MDLVLLPGMDGTGVLFEPFVAALPPSLRPIVVRYPGDLATDYAGHVDVARAALPRDGPFVLIGESPHLVLQVAPTECAEAVVAFVEGIERG